MVSGKLDLSVMIGNHCVNMVDYDSETPVEDGDETQIQVGADMRAHTHTANIYKCTQAQTHVQPSHTSTAMDGTNV